MYRIRETLESDRAPVDVRHTLDLPGQVDDLPAREDLCRARDRAEPGGQVQHAASEAAVDRHGFPGVQADPDRERQRRIRDGLVDEPALEIDRCTDRLAGRVEYHEGLVAAELDDGSAT